MERSRWRRPSPALVVACLALFVALGGTVLAATKIDGRTIQVKSLPGNRAGGRLAAGQPPGAGDDSGQPPGARLDQGRPDRHRDPRPGPERRPRRPPPTPPAAPTPRPPPTTPPTRRRSTAGAWDARKESANSPGACWDVRPSATALTATEAAAACAAEGGELPAPLALLAFVAATRRARRRRRRVDERQCASTRAGVWSRRHRRRQGPIGFDPNRGQPDCTSAA